MIVPKWTTKGEYKAYGYPIITTRKSLAEFCKRKRRLHVVKFKGRLLPHKCARCGKMIGKDDANLVDVFPRQRRYAAFHYICAWESTIEWALKVGEQIGML